MNEIAEFEKFLNDLTKDYFDTLNINPTEDIKITFQISPDMNTSYTQLISELNDFNLNKFMKVDDYNGIMVPPKNLDGTFTILLHEKRMLENMEQGNYSWVGTIVHELTHIIDYIEYAKLIKASNYIEIRLDNEGNMMFYLWTEFNARSKGYYFVRKYSFGNAMFDEGLIDDIINRELPLQNDFLFDVYHSTSDGVKQCYYVVQYLGRLYALQLIFPNYFNSERIKSMDIINGNKWMMDLYDFLSVNNTLEKAHLRFNDMKKILETNFQFDAKWKTYI